MIHAVETASKAIAITFDDGPNPLYTPQVLEIFRSVGGRATFFMLGDPMEAHPETVRSVLQEGHEIGNHSYAHPNLTEIDAEEGRRELERASALVERLTGRRPSVFRPPFLAANEATAALASQLKMPMIGAVNTKTRDWEQPGVAHILDHTRPHVRAGAILLFHDGFGDRAQTIDAVRTLVAELDAQGYALVTVSELLALQSAG
ncbi:polysaccharide deacetylase family protein [Cohnella nanjingensis]|uniref:Polysaccharide deacetylase family protein n=1 Tax=Cohnella nanjingensis TaxID=1387779 RepID=A0A7X0RL85_9BACL|nr:polysaccharide deacetylase family protein [Cohnella nanjingensis]MBB6669552.1 polysaccharide deacetylase family protein [Cohnella nanjingensis]